jgi:predicted phage terminase large subunit-like protein
VDVRSIRYWDLAYTKDTGNNDPDFTTGVRLDRTRQGIFIVSDVRRFRGTPLEVERAILATAQQDGHEVEIGIEQAPAAGKAEIGYHTRNLAGFNVHPWIADKSKVTRAGPVAAQVEAGNIKLLRAPWNTAFLDEIEQFPNGAHDDQCLAEGSLILTDIGEIPIERISSGDRVLTRMGFKRVIWCGKTSESAKLGSIQAGGRTLFATGNHPIFLDGIGYSTLDTIYGAFKLSLWVKALLTLVGRISDTPSQNDVLTESISNAMMHGRKLQDISTGINGLTQMVQLRKILKSITRMAIPSITHSKTLNALPSKGIGKFMPIGAISERQKYLPTLTEYALSLLHGTNLKPAGNGIENTLLRVLTRQGNLDHSFVYFVEKDSSPLTFNLNSALRSVLKGKDTSVCIDRNRVFALCAETNSGRIHVVRQLVARVDVAAVFGHASNVPVWNIQVEGLHEYFANGILVHNCDSLSGAFNTLAARCRGGAAASVTPSREIGRESARSGLTRARETF